MRTTGIFLLVVLSLTLSFSGCNIADESGMKVMVVTGGHAYDTVEFEEMIGSFVGFDMEIVMQPSANQIIGSGAADKFEVIVFYDMWSEIDSVGKAGYNRLLDRGIGMVFLHHALVSYQQWDEFKDIIGGRYYTEESGVDTSMYSTFHHDIELNVEVSRNDHPVTRGVTDYTIQDEGYKNIGIRDGIMVVLTTEHDDCDPYVGWVNTYKNSKIVYLMGGHDKQAYANENFRKLLGNSIKFVYRQGQSR
ncbi:MAG: ThuA domain-containing protein [Bacteroidales bacterium]